MDGSEESAFAVLTPPGRGGIAVIRCVGPAAEAALARCFRAVRSSPDRSSPERKLGVMPLPGQLAYGHVIGADGQPIDEVILFNAGLGAVREPPAAPAAGSMAAGSMAAGSMAAGSRTVSSIFEVNCHGGPAAVRAVRDRLAAAGLREVDADHLMELEGLPRLVRDARRALRKAFTPLAARILLDQLNGALAGAIESILRAPAIAAVDALLSRWQTCGRFLADPPRIVIAGRPNAGKSTLLNALVGAERAITSAAPGTTRDYVEAEAALQGAPVVLVDTAGLSEAAGEIERQGVERARRELARAAVVIYLIDAAGGATPEDQAVLASLGERALVVLNKIDSCLAASQGRARFSPAISALTGEGVPGLVAAVLKKLIWRAPGRGAAVPFAADQAEALHAARNELAAGRTNEAKRRLMSVLA